MNFTNLHAHDVKTTSSTTILLLITLCALMMSACEPKVSSNVERHLKDEAAASEPPSTPPAKIVEPLREADASRSPIEHVLPESLSEDEGVTNPEVVVMMHGYNSTHRDFGPAAELAAAEHLAGLSLPAPIINAPTRFQWERDDIAATHQYIQDALATSFEGKRVRKERVWLVGFSQGGMYAALLSAQYPESYRGALAIAPAGWATVPSEEGCPDAAREPGKVVVVTGEAENPIYKEKTDDVVAFLKRCDMLQEVVTHPGGHQFPADWRESFGEVFKRWFTSGAQLLLE